MVIDHPKEAALLSYALELAAACSVQFHAHVSGMILDILAGEYSWSDIKLHESLGEVAMFKEESPADTPIKLPVGVEVLQVTPALVDMAFAEIAHRVKWDIVMAKHRDANKFIGTIFRHGNVSDEPPAQH
ncbi:hypothetical protein [Roseateles sp. LYH14W]|uniref:Uncharacterized protein n=1 Tax=Pelomonas parva TaxID=3299032 RepID=A0ABW7FDT0_9BURK